LREARTERLRKNPAMDVIRRRLLVHGRVQGVFFRDSTRARARREGVAGWARNRSDGTVEVVLEGGPDAVARVAAFCERGPRGARVELVESSDERSEGLRGFQVR
jgi:acylphosphatase